MAGVTLADLQTEIFETCWPINSFFITADNRNPNQIIKGAGNSSWEKIEDRFLISAGDIYPNGSTGGQATVTLTGDQIPSHTHNINSAGAHTHTRGTMNIKGEITLSWSDSSGGGVIVPSSRNHADSAIYFTRKGGSSYAKGTNANSASHLDTMMFDASRNWTGETSSNGNHTHSISNTGGNQPHSNIPPYIAVNIWKRIS